jgi:hypothetical protein
MVYTSLQRLIATLFFADKTGDSQGQERGQNSSSQQQQQQQQQAK